MKKKALILASMGVLACTVGVTALAAGGTGKFRNVLVHAEPDPDVKPGEYSITFDEKSSIKVDFSDIAIYTTTTRGNKLGVVGFNTDFEFLRFGEVHFMELDLHDASSTLINAGAEDFDHITGFKISFSGGSLQFVKFPHETVFNSVTSGLRYDVSITPEDDPTFARDEHSEDIVAISSLTIYYTC